MGGHRLLPRGAAVVTGADAFACAGSRVDVCQIKVLSLSACLLPCQPFHPVRLGPSQASDSGCPQSALMGVGEGEAGRSGSRPPRASLGEFMLLLYAVFGTCVVRGFRKAALGWQVPGVAPLLHGSVTLV